MLALKRKPGESIIITSPDGTRITVLLAAIHSNGATVAVSAPREWRVNRSEVQERVDQGAAEPTP